MLLWCKDFIFNDSIVKKKNWLDRAIIWQWACLIDIALLKDCHMTVKPLHLLRGKFIHPATISPFHVKKKHDPLDYVFYVDIFHCVWSQYRQLRNIAILVLFIPLIGTSFSDFYSRYNRDNNIALKLHLCCYIKSHCHRFHSVHKHNRHSMFPVLFKTFTCTESSYKSQQNQFFCLRT